MVLHIPKTTHKPGQIGWLEWQEEPRPDGGHYGARQGYFEVARRVGRSTSVDDDDFLDVVPGMDPEGRWVLKCGTCLFSRIYLNSRIVPVFERCRDLAVPGLYLHDLAARLD